MLFKLPFYTKAILLSVGLYFIISMLYIAQAIIVPIIFGTIIAILLHPVVRFFEKRKMNRILAISISLLISIIVVVAFGIFMFWQLSMFSDSWPIFVEKSTELINQTIHWIPGYFDISALKVNNWIAETKAELLDGTSLVIGKTIVSVGGSLVALFLIPFYVFLILFYKPILMNFIHQLFEIERQAQITTIVSQTKTVIQQYLVPMFVK